MTKHLLLFLSLLLSATGLLGQATLPFSEDWESGTFVTNGWAANNGDGFANAMANGVNGSLALNFGHAIPRLGNAPTTIESPWIDATEAKSGLLYFSFEYAFLNADSTRWEMLQVYCDTGSGWQLVIELSYFASLDWRTYTTHLQQAMGTNFRLKFQVLAESESASGTWLVDNINVWSSSKVDFTVESTVNANPVTGLGIGLTWNEPASNSAVSYATDTLNYHTNEELGHNYSGLKWAYGPVFPISSFSNSLFYEFEFMQHVSSIPLSRVVFNIRFIDWDAQLLIDSLGPFISDGNSKWVKKIPLNLREFNNINNLGVFVEPLDTNIYNCVIPEFVLGSYITEPHSFGYKLTPPIWNIPFGYEFLMNLVLLDKQTGKKIYLAGSKSTPTYNLHRWQESLPLNYTLMNATPLSDTSYFDAAVEKGWYSYFVEATYPNQQVLYSDTARAYMPTSAGLIEPSHAQVSLFPNPAQHQLHINTQQSITGLQLLNSQGRQVANLLPEPTQALTVPLVAFAPGLYVARITFANGTVGSYTFVKE